MEHFKVIQKLGDGVFGSCVKAMDTRTGRLVAIKTFKNSPQEQSSEIAILKKLDHVNIIKLIDGKNIDIILVIHKPYSIVLEYADQNILSLY